MERQVPLSMQAPMLRTPARALAAVGLCRSSKSARAEIWRLAWATIDDSGGLDSSRMLRVRAHAARASAQIHNASGFHIRSTDEADNWAKWSAERARAPEEVNVRSAKARALQHGAIVVRVCRHSAS